MRNRLFNIIFFYRQLKQNICDVCKRPIMLFNVVGKRKNATPGIAFELADKEGGNEVTPTLKASNFTDYYGTSFLINKTLKSSVCFGGKTGEIFVDKINENFTLKNEFLNYLIFKINEEVLDVFYNGYGSEIVITVSVSFFIGYYFK